MEIVPAVYAVATKLVAFDGRGEEDFAASHDLEDFLSVVDGREELIGEVRTAEPRLRQFISERIAALLSEARFLEALPGHLPGDPASQAASRSCSNVSAN